MCFRGVEIVGHPFLAFVAAGAGPVGLDFADCIHLVPVFAHVCGNLCFRFVERGSVVAVQHAVGLAVDGFGAVKTQIDVSGVGSSLSDVLGCIMPFHARAPSAYMSSRQLSLLLLPLPSKLKCRVFS